MINVVTVTYQGAVAPTKSDTVNDPLGPFAAFYVGATGDVKVTTEKGQDVVFKAVPAGTTVAISHTRVWSTGTASTSILCLQDVRGFTS